MTRTAIAAFVLCVLNLGALAPAVSAQNDFQADWDREVKILVPRLAELAAWAQKQKLFRECIRTYALMIDLEPDHAHARRVLRYRRKGKDGPWERTRPFKVPKNLSEAALNEFNGKRAALLTPFVKVIVESLERNEESISAEQREQVLRKLIRMDPDNADARRAFGDVKTGDRWLPEDAVVAGVRRKELAKAARSIRDASPVPREAELSPADKALGIPFTTRITTGKVRVLSASDRAEASTIARYCHAAPRLFNELLNAAYELPEDFTVFVIPLPDHKKQFLDRHPDITPENRKFYEKVGGGWVNNSDHMVNWSNSTEARIDYSVRQVNALMFIREFRITMRQGWVWEGFGLYLTDLICGTKLTYYVRPSGYGNGEDDLRKRLMSRSTNWFHEGLTLLRSPDRPKLGAILSADATGMADEDMLIAYVVAAWLIETQSTKLHDILRTVALVDERGQPKVLGPAAIQMHLGIDLDTLERRIIRWLEAVVSEMKDDG